MNINIFELTGMVGMAFCAVSSVWVLGAFAMFVIEKTIKRAEFFTFVWKYLQHKNVKTKRTKPHDPTGSNREGARGAGNNQTNRNE